MSDSQRLSKRLMELIQCSRREAELYIEGGWVRVDGEVVEQPQRKVQNEEVVLDPAADLTRAGPATLIVHADGAPGDGEGAFLQAQDRWPEDPIQVPVMTCHLKKLQICLPLNKGVSGMQVLTQNLGLTRHLASVQSKLEQEFVVDVQGELAPAELALLNCGLSFQGRALPPAKVSWQSESRLRFALKNPIDGQLRSMCEQVGLQVHHIKRIRIGAIPLRKMAPGQWRYFPNDGRF